jgi:hypothetical protein
MIPVLKLQMYIKYFLEFQKIMQVEIRIYIIQRAIHNLIKMIQSIAAQGI